MDVFAEFYKDLYQSRGTSQFDFKAADSATALQDITPDEVIEGLRKMAKNEAADKAGIVVEMLQAGSGSLREVIAILFSEIRKGDRPTPDSWKKSYITVLFKKGDATLPENYRPFALLSILYQLFARIVSARLRKTLEAAQSVDQAGFRSGFACDDHLQAIVLLVEARSSTPHFGYVR